LVRQPVCPAGLLCSADLSAATATENTFDVNVAVLTSSDMQEVIYSGALRPVLDIDFSDIANPVIQTLDFAGVGGDIQHTDATFNVPLGAAILNGVQGRIETFPGSSPAPVTGGNTYSSADHEIIAWMGTIDIVPVVGSGTIINLMTNSFRSSLGGTNDSTVNLTLNNITAGIATYDLELITPLQNVQLQTGNGTIDTAITITIDGNLVARGQITRAVPEPTSLTLLAGLTILIHLRRQRS